jgi:hypothetical protein
VNIYRSSGVIAMTKSVVVNRMLMEGGTLVLGQTDCPDGWTPGPDTGQFLVILLQRHF